MPDRTITHSGTTYRGSGTVWHDVATGRRAATSVEAQLSDIDWLKSQKAPPVTVRLAELLAWLEEIEEKCIPDTAIRLQTSSIRHAALEKWGGKEEEVGS